MKMSLLAAATLSNADVLLGYSHPPEVGRIKKEVFSVFRRTFSHLSESL